MAEINCPREDDSEEHHDGDQDSSQAHNSKSRLRVLLPLPLASSLWGRRNLEDLGVYIDEARYQTIDSDPSEMLKVVIGDRNWSNEKLVKQTAAIIHHSLAYHWLDCPLDSLTIGKCIIEKLLTCNDMWDLDIGGIKDSLVMSEFKTAYKIAGKEFTERLVGCIQTRDKHGSLTENSYQHLFISFLKLFGIRCHFQPLQSDKSMNLNGKVITGKADVSAHLLSYQSVKLRPVIEWKTLLICGVKKEFTRDDVHAPKRARHSNQANADKMPSVPPAVVGQHGAELLLYYPSTLFKEHIFGMIVEQTHITFTAMEITEDQYNKIMTGKLNTHIVNGPKLFISKSYDYLVWEDRKYITQTLLMLGFLQNSTGTDIQGLHGAIYCPLGWVGSDGVCFMFNLNKLTWFDAEIFCHQQGAYLATINSSTRQNTIQDFLHVFQGMNETKNEGIAPWIGATDYIVSGEWRWIGNGELLNISYTNWDTLFDPNNSSNCALVNAINQKWSNFNCNNLQGSICEMKPTFAKINKSKRQYSSKYGKMPKQHLARR